LTEVDSALVRTLQAVSMTAGLAAMVPQDSAYNMLKQEYERYRRIASSNGWSTLAKAPTSTQLASRLSAEGYMVDSTRTTVEQAIRLFQERHGLPVNGRVDKATIDALNVPAIERVHQIASNLERHRWLPRTLGTRYIYVNVPAFHLEVYDSGQKKLEMKIVVGVDGVRGFQTVLERSASHCREGIFSEIRN
jgi:L,D-transpeptidase YcbB